MNNNKSMVTFTPEKLDLFKKAFVKAVGGEQDQFTFEGREYVTGYAKYVIEYLDGEFNK